MNSKCLLFIGLTLFAFAAARPKNKMLNLGAESDTETKIREKRKYEIPLLRQLEERGKEVKRELPPEEPKASEVGEREAEGAGPSEATEGEKDVKGEPEVPPAGGLRVKKQSPNNVCIKVGGCGKTVCGPVVSARGPVVADMRTLMQGGKPLLPLGDFRPGPFDEMGDGSSKVDRFAPVQGRTVDTIVAPLSLGTMGYGTPAAYSAPSPGVDLGHSFFKPPVVPTFPALAVIAAPHAPSHPLIHPWLVPHLMPHLLPQVLPSLMSNVGSFFGPHRLDPTRFPENIQTEIKQPVPAFSPPSFGIGGDNTLLCQPFRNQRLEGPYDYVYKPDLGLDKSINVTDGSKKSRNEVDPDEDRKIYEHLRKVNEIKEEISQLNRAAQKIVDQQERLTAMQQKQMWGGQGGTSGQSSDQMTGHYMGSGYFPHPSIPWGYSRSSILSYPRSHDDIDFFINLMRAGKKMGLLSDGVQPTVLSTIGDVLKGGQDGTKVQKEALEGSAQSEDTKTVKTEKKKFK